MKILVEGHAYAPETVRGVLPENRVLLTDGSVLVEHVGYWRNPAIGDFVFFLPKVLLEPLGAEEGGGHRVFRRRGADGKRRGGFRPEALVDPETARDEDGEPLREEEKAFLYGFSVWIYRALQRYRERNPGTAAVWCREERQAGAFRRKYETGTLLDVILSLLRFQRENAEYFLFRVKEKHAGAGRIDWTRTVAREQGLADGDGSGVVYPAPRTKRRVVDFDEELLVLFYSVLAHVREAYGFRTEVPLGYELVRGAAFRRLLAGGGVRRLRRIRGKYFGDRERTLWRLCHAFFDESHRTDVSGDREQYLLAKDFERVFEGIVDDLIGDGETAHFRDLADGKRIDHLYLDESLVRRGREMFHVADSKYYKRGGALGRESVAKQFTYARDFLQLDLDLFLGGEDADGRTKRRRKALEGVGLVRDSTTEGYDIIPNFFVSATMPEDSFDYESDGLRPHGGTPEFRNMHFENRLFDRDTLILSHWDVNFLYLLRLYVRHDAFGKANWKARVRNLFRAQIGRLLEEKFEFRAMMPLDGVDDARAEGFLRAHFREAIGKVFAPGMVVGGTGADGRHVFWLALERPGAAPDDGSLTEAGRAARAARIREENARVAARMGEMFYVVPCPLGENPAERLAAEAAAHPLRGPEVAGAGRAEEVEELARRALSSASVTPDEDAHWMWLHKAFFMDSKEYGRRRMGVPPEEIRIVSIAWKPPVTLVVAPGCVRTDVEASTLQEEFSDFPRTGGRYHVWFGELANAENWANRFACN